jgi:hypothetical protein
MQKDFDSFWEVESKSSIADIRKRFPNKTAEILIAQKLANKTEKEMKPSSKSFYSSLGMPSLYFIAIKAKELKDSGITDEEAQGMYKTYLTRFHNAELEYEEGFNEDNAEKMGEALQVAKYNNLQFQIYNAVINPYLWEKDIDKIVAACNK